MNITRPEMIIFDYGHTLLCEPDWNSDRGNADLMKYIIKNPNNCTFNDIRTETQKVFGEIENVRKTFGYDISARVGNRLTFEHLGIEFSLTPLEQEIIFWTSASSGAIMPYADEMLDYLNKTGIRTAVISNNLWSGEAIKDRFDRLLPNNKFEFVMSSSDYMLRKPDKRLFEIALSKAGLSSDKVWYCGDNFENDVIGANNAGIFPVFYDYTAEKNDASTEFDFLHIHHWRELIEVMEGKDA
ncbi:MAG: HAD family hydrolase [Ruminococcaceae bacterium]|nr:HAD family hydrolase [Oscillospiraceae bacterium]